MSNGENGTMRILEVIVPIVFMAGTVYYAVTALEKGQEKLGQTQDRMVDAQAAIRQEIRVLSEISSRNTLRLDTQDDRIKSIKERMKELEGRKGG